MPTRRAFLATSGAFLALPRLAQASQPRRLTARAASVQIAPPDYPATTVWGYEGQFPGPVLRLRQGEPVRFAFENRLEVPTSVHWHGLRIDNAMDGVSGLTQDPVQPGAGFDYAFTPPDAGSFWYHAHRDSVEQVGRGLLGALIVEEAEPPEVDRDEVLMIDDVRLDPATGAFEADFAQPHDRSHAGRFGNLVVVNGRYDLETPVRRGERLRLRLINGANARIFELGLAGLTGWTVAEDGMPLAAPRRVAERFVLAPGQRADLIVDVTAGEGEEAHLVQFARDGGYSLVVFPVTGARSGPLRPEPAPLPANPRTGLPALDGAAEARLVMEGGAMGRLRAAVLGGERRSFRQLAEANMFWSFNGVVGMTEAPAFSFRLGQSVRLQMVNDTAFPHAMHLHGMHFRQIGRDGAMGPLRDTLLMDRGESAEVAFVADNPGRWLLHCHMLSHAAAGMTTWIEVG